MFKPYETRDFGAAMRRDRVEDAEYNRQYFFRRYAEEHGESPPDAYYISCTEGCGAEEEMGRWLYAYCLARWDVKTACEEVLRMFDAYWGRMGYTTPDGVYTIFRFSGIELEPDSLAIIKR